jgi:hypothetical protein
MLMRVRGGTAALVAACAGVCVPAAPAAPPQGLQTNATFAASYSQRGITSVAATTQQVSCYAPQVFYTGSLSPAQGYPDGGSTLCNGAATTGEDNGPFPTQDVSNPPLRAKDFPESDLHIDPTNAQHLIGISKWIVNSEGYNHLTGFFESFDGGATWPQLGHIPGYEGWTDNSDPVGAFDPWGNFYAVVFPYQFSYMPSGQHFFLSPDVNPLLPRSGMGIAVRPQGAATATAWNTTHGGQLDLIERTPFNGRETFDKQWLANRHESPEPALRPRLRHVGDREPGPGPAHLRLVRGCARRRYAHELVAPSARAGTGPRGGRQRLAPTRRAGRDRLARHGELPYKQRAVHDVAHLVT